MIKRLTSDEVEQRWLKTVPVADGWDIFHGEKSTTILKPDGFVCQFPLGTTDQDLLNEIKKAKL